MKDNVDLTIDRVYSSETNNVRLTILFCRGISRSFQRRKLWKKDISLYLDDPDYSGIDKEHKFIPTGNRRERADHMMMYEEVYGLEKEAIKEHRKPWT